MATFAEMLIQGAQNQAQSSGEQLTGGIKAGAALAESIENMRRQRDNLELEKQKVEMQKWEKGAAMFETYAKLPEGAAKKLYGTKVIPTNLSALGLDKKMDPALQEMMIKDEKLATVLMSEIRSGNLPMTILANSEQAMEYVAKLGLDKTYNAQQIQDTVERTLPELDKADEFNRQAQNTRKNAEIAAEATMGRQLQEQSVVGQQTVTKKVAEDYAKFTSGGGQAKIEAKLKKLDAVIADLESGKIDTGTLGKKLSVLPGGQTVQAITDPKFKAAQDAVKSAIEIKSILDSQFSDRAMEETQRQLGLDPVLPNALNLKKLKDLRESLRNDTDSKIREFKNQGFIKESPKQSIQFTPRQKEMYQSASPAEKAAIRKRLGLTEAEAAKRLGK